MKAIWSRRTVSLIRAHLISFGSSGESVALVSGGHIAEGSTAKGFSPSILAQSPEHRNTPTPDHAEFIP